jgi:RNA polymerase sigma-70 factor (ECF subfamily)
LDPWLIDALLHHDDLLRRVVEPIVGRGETHDVVQRIWMRLLARAPRPPRALEPWLSAVAANTARSHRRGEVTRVRHETEAKATAAAQAAAPHEAASTAEAAAAVGAALRSLRRAWRETIVNHYVHGLSVAEIARRDGDREGTVRMRLMRGVRALRRELRRRHGPGWTELLGVVLVGSPTPAGAAPRHGGGDAAPATAIAPPKVVGAWGAGVLALAAVATFVVAVRGGWAPLPPSARAESAVPVLRAAVAEVPAPRTMPAAATRPAPVAADHVRGRVCDVTGAALAGVAVVCRSQGQESGDVSDGAGEFMLPVARVAPSSLGVGHDHVCLGATAGAVGSPVLLLAAPAIAVQVVVREGAGAVADGPPIEGATVRLEHRVLAAFPGDVHHLRRREVRGGTTSGFAGALRVALPRIAEGRLWVEAPGFHAAAVPMATVLAQWPAPIEVHLTREPAVVSRVVRGTVFDAMGGVVAGAQVVVGGESVRAGGDGTFGLRVVGRGGDLFAWHAEHGGAVVPAHEFAATPSAPSHVAVVLAPERRTVRGQLVDERGDPLVGWLVYVADPTWLEPRGSRTLEGEAWSLGADSAADAEPGNAPPPLASPTDADGRFAIGGLRQRTYHLRAVDPVSLGSGPAVAIGPHDAPIVWTAARVVGGTRTVRVRDGDGSPLVEARVAATFAPYEDRPAVRARLHAVAVDARGAARIAAPAAGQVDTLVVVSHPACMPAAFAGRSQPDMAHVDVRLERIRTVRIAPEDLVAFAGATSLQFENARGDVVLGGAHEHEGFRWRLCHPLGGDALPLLHTAATAHAAVFTAAGREVGRIVLPTAPVAGTGAR